MCVGVIRFWCSDQVPAGSPGHDQHVQVRRQILTTFEEIQLFLMELGSLQITSFRYCQENLREN